MNVTRLKSMAEWNAIQSDWSRLAGASPCESWAWMTSWWKHYGQQRELFVLVVRDGHRVVCIAPWFLEHSAAEGRCIRVLGSGKVCSDYIALLTAQDHRATATGAIAEWLRDSNHDGQASHRWDVLHLEGVRKDEHAILGLVGELERFGQSIHCEPTDGCWRLEVPGSRKEFLSSLKKYRRRKFRNIFDRYIDNGRATLTLASDSTFDELYETLVDYHQRRWRLRGIQGCHSSPQFAGFLRETTQAFRKVGQALLASVEIDGIRSACSLGFVVDNVHYLYQTGMDPTARSHQAGWTLNLLHIQHAINNGIRAIDFMRGDEPYKARFGSRRIPCQNYRIAADRPLARLRHKAWLATRTVKEMTSGSLGVLFPRACELSTDSAPQQ